jgi:hypothetical protein
LSPSTRERFPFKEIGGQNWEDGRNNATWFMKKSDFDENFGPPSRTQTIGDKVYWHWTMHDGIIHVEVDLECQPLVTKEYFPLRAVNDY